LHEVLLAAERALLVAPVGDGRVAAVVLAALDDADDEVPTRGIHFRFVWVGVEINVDLRVGSGSR
jgi:hypothetical protein